MSTRHGVQRADLVAAAREAGDAAFDVLIACAFNYEAHATEFTKLGRIPVLKARMNADLHMAEDLKNTGKGNLFIIFGDASASDIAITAAATPAWDEHILVLARQAERNRS
jgi:adenine-specific DNA-methyltransferase